MGVKTDFNKAEQVYLYIIKRLQDKPNFGKTLFYKILYFSDFDFYERNGRSITGDEYKHIPLGPAPCAFDRIITDLKRRKAIEEHRVQLGNKEQIRFHFTPEFIEQDISLEISSDEKAEIDRNIQRMSGMTASQASEYSHEDMPVKATKKGETIKYPLVHYRNPMFSVTSKGCE